MYFTSMSLVYLAYFGFLSFLALTVLYVLLFAVAGRLGKADDSGPLPQTPRLRRIGVLIPAYKEDAVIIDSVKANLLQQYPAELFDLIIIADSMQPATLARLADLPIRVMEVSFEVSTVAKALNAALARIPDGQYDIMVVADADNIMAPDFLVRINAAFEQGWRAVQGHRVAKNTNTGVALLDAISEEINNHIFRKGTRSLGLSSPVIGSGMAFDLRLMKACMTNLRTMGGYDKELEINVELNGYIIGYLEQAYIYDEKVAQRAIFENQRTRWIAAQFQFLRMYYRKGLAELAKGHPTPALSMLRQVVLPRVLLLGVLGLCTLLALLTFNPALWAAPMALLITLCFSLFISIPAYLRQRVTLRELMLIPMLMLSFGRAVLNMRKAFKRFMHTPHTGSPDVHVP